MESLSITLILTSVIAGIAVNILASYLEKPIREAIKRFQVNFNKKHLPELSSENERDIQDYLNYIVGFKKIPMNLSLRQVPNETRLTLGDFYFPIKIKNSADGTEQVSDLENLLNLKKRKVAIVGSPGSGKTTLLHYLVSELGDQYSSEKLLPVYLDASRINFVEAEDFPQWLSYNIKSSSQILLKPELLRELLENGSLWIVIDSIDSAKTHEDRRKLLTLIVKASMQFPESSFLITLRSLLVKEIPTGFEIYELIGLTKDDAKKFISQTTQILLNELPDQSENFKETLNKHTLELLHLLDTNETLKSSSSNPLLLRLTYENHFHRAVLPNKTALLYQEYLNTIIAKSPEQPSRATYSILENLALQMSTEQKSEITSEELLNLISNKYTETDTKFSAPIFLNYCKKSGLLNENTPDTHSFFHKSFQEYLAARAILYNSEEKILVDSFPDPSWKNVLLMYCGLNRDSSRLVANLFSKSSKSIYEVALLGECIREVTYIDDNLKLNVLQALAKKLLEEQAGTSSYTALLNSCKGISNPTVSRIILKLIQNSNPSRKYKGLKAVEAIGELDPYILEDLNEMTEDEDVLNDSTDSIKIADVALTVKNNLQLLETAKVGESYE